MHRYNLIYFLLCSAYLKVFYNASSHANITVKRVGKGVPENKSPFWAVIGWYTDPSDVVYVMVVTSKVWAFENIDNKNGWNGLQCKLVATLYRSDFQWNFNVNKWALTYAINALIFRGLGALHRITHKVRLQVFMFVTGSHVVHTNTNWFPSRFYCHIVKSLTAWHNVTILFF